MNGDRRSQRIQGLAQSYIRRMTRECDRVTGINLGQGICDLPTPHEILAGASEAILADKSTYSRFEGIDSLREAIAEKARSYNGIEGVDPATDVVVTIGATGAFNCVLQSLFEPGDELIVFEPYYGYHVNTATVAGVVPRFVTLEPPAWSFSREDIEALCNERTKGILVNTPGNPSGKVYSRQELELIAEICVEKDLIAVTDEIYEYIVYEPDRHLSLASLDGMWDRTVTISGFSKTFSITGWRVGYAVAPAALSGPIGLVNDLLYICAPTPLQHGLAVGMSKLSEDYFQQMAEDYKAKRDLFCEALETAGLSPCVPAGSYYVLADIRSLGCEDDIAAAMKILEAVGVASVPGSSFFSSAVGKTLTRFCYAKDWDVLREACRRIERLPRV
jgi:aminotransferase